MAKMLGYCEQPEDAALLKKAAKEAAAQLDLPKWQAELLVSLALFLETLNANDMRDIYCMDITPAGTVQIAEAIRQRFANARLLLLASLDTSPMTYLRPSIRASSLLLRPFTEEQARQVMRELLEDMIRETMQKNQNSYILETKQERLTIPYCDILYFESRERRIYLCTKNQQIPFYNTLEQLMEELPVQFMRCHKGFIVNIHNIEGVTFSKNMIALRGGFTIPLSRSYKTAVRAVISR